MSCGQGENNGDTIFISDECHPQTIDVVRTRAIPVGINVVVSDFKTFKTDKSYFAAVVQYPATKMEMFTTMKILLKQAHASGYW